jgi:hypothetical protein
MVCGTVADCSHPSPTCREISVYSSLEYEKSRILLGFYLRNRRAEGISPALHL